MRDYLFSTAQADAAGHKRTFHHVIRDLAGTTGLAIVDAVLDGERDPHKLAQLRNRHIQASEETIMKSLVGDYREEHAFSRVAFRSSTWSLKPMVAPA